jgi:hypothetical protein
MFRICICRKWFFHSVSSTEESLPIDHDRVDLATVPLWQQQLCEIHGAPLELQCKQHAVWGA